MAITRSQQAKQMLQDGGRIGLKKGKMSDNRQQYSAQQTQTGRVKGGGPGGKTDAFVSGDRGRESKQEFETAVGISDLQKLEKEGVPKSNIPGLTGMALNIFNPLRNKALEANIARYKRTTTGPYTLAGYKKYMEDMRERFTSDDNDDPFIPVNQMSTNMDQAPKEEVLSPIQQAIRDRGDATAFLATGGRVGLKGGADASQFGKSPSEQKSVDISPTGSVTLGSGPPEGPDDRRTSADQDMVQMLVNQGLTPKEIRRITEGPNVIDRIKESPLNNPLTRGILRTGLYTLNPTLGPVDFRKAMQLKGVYDTTMENIYGDVDMDDITLGATELSTKGGILNDPFMEKQVIERITQAENDYMRKTGNLPPEFMGDRIRMNMYKGAMQGFKGPGFAEGGPVGGIMDLESGRQMYFLGKLVKKATRAVKKIVKSPIGKAALLYAGGTYLGGLKGITGAKKSMGFLEALRTPSNLGNLFTFGKEYIGDAIGGMEKKDLFKLGVGGALTLAPLLFQEDDQEDEYQKFLAQRNAGGQLPASIPDIRDRYKDYMARGFLADGGRPEPVAKKTMPLLDMDGKEKDYRETGGFVPIGRMERADDVPARLSKNEFVFTADAVRNAGEGDIDKGAEVMYNMMKNLEAGGEVSEESQGLEGARKMFQTSQRLEEVL